MFRFYHYNINVSDLEKSLAFYGEALGLSPVRTIEKNDFTIVFLGDGKSGFLLEITALKNHPQKYDLGEGEFHLAVTADDVAAAREKHEKMGCVCFDNPAMGIYFIEDPDGYWIEICKNKDKR